MVGKAWTKYLRGSGQRIYGLANPVENQKYAPRITVLGRIPASVRFVSAEPLLDRLDLTHWIEDGTLHWIIAGGESGPSARPMDIDWVRDLRDQAAKAHIAFFFKQLGGRRGKRSGEAEALLDGNTWTSMPEFNRDKGE